MIPPFMCQSRNVNNYDCGSAIAATRIGRDLFYSVRGTTDRRAAEKASHFSRIALNKSPGNSP